MFRRVLESMLERVEGTQAVSLIALDGIAIDSINPGNVPIESLGAELGSFLKSIRLSNTELETGDVEQFALVTSSSIAFLSAITSDYYILMILSRDGNYGRARYELMKAKFALQDELI